MSASLGVASSLLSDHCFSLSGTPLAGIIGPSINDYHSGKARLVDGPVLGMAYECKNVFFYGSIARGSFDGFR